MAVALICVAVVSVPTMAQDEAAGKPARIRAGAFAIVPTLTIQDVGYDSNVYNVNDQPTSDFTFTVIPTFVVSAGTRRNRLTVRSATDLVYFSEQRSERSVNEDLNARMRASLGRLFVFADGGYLNTRQRPTEEIDARSRRSEHRGTVGAGVEVSPKLAAQVSGGYSRIAFDADSIFNGTLLALELNRTDQTITAGLRYAATPLTTFSVDGAVDRSRFLQSPIRDSNSFRTVVGVETRPRALVAGSATIGVERFRPLSPAMPDFDGIIGSADLRYRLSGTTTLRCRFERTLASSYLEDDPYYLRQGYELSVRRRLVERWTVDVSGNRFSHRYEHADVLPAGHIDPDERFVEGQVAVAFQARQDTTLSVFLTYRDRQSAYAYRTYDSFRIGTAAVYGF
jgi:hypothetical protein